MTADEVLVATGRRPRSDSVGLETVGLEPGSWIDVDETMLVNGADGEGDWLYAVGDVNHRALLTHQGKYQGRAAGDVIVARALGRPVDASPWGVHAATADHSAVPGVVFSEPECASVGLTEAGAADAGIEVRIADVPIQSASGAGILADGYEGRARLVVDAERGVVLGATFVGQDVAELLQAATIAVVGEVPVDRLWHAVPAFPTMSEVWLQAPRGPRPARGRRVSGPTVRIRLTDSPISRAGYWWATAVGFAWGFLWSTGPHRVPAGARRVHGHAQVDVRARRVVRRRLLPHRSQRGRRGARPRGRAQGAVAHVRHALPAALPHRRPGPAAEPLRDRGGPGGGRLPAAAPARPATRRQPPTR